MTDSEATRLQTEHQMLVEHVRVLLRNSAGYFSAIEIDTYGKDRVSGDEWCALAKELIGDAS